MKKIDIVNMNNALQEAGRLKIKDTKVGYGLYKVSREINKLVQGYAEYIKSLPEEDMKKAEQELLMQDEDFDCKIEGLEQALLDSDLEIDYMLLGTLIDMFNK